MLSEVLHKLTEIGVQLGIPRRKLKELEKEDDPLSAVIDYWLRGNVDGLPPTWRSIVTVLNSKHVDESGLAKRIQKLYLPEESVPDNGKIYVYGIIHDSKLWEKNAE